MTDDNDIHTYKFIAHPFIFKKNEIVDLKITKLPNGKIYIKSDNGRYLIYNNIDIFNMKWKKIC